LGGWVLDGALLKHNRLAFFEQYNRCRDCGEWMRWFELNRYGDDEEIRSRVEKRYTRCAKCASLRWAEIELERMIADFKGLQ